MNHVFSAPTSGWRGRLDVAPALCRPECHACVHVCPTAAITLEPLTLDLGACVSCGACTTVCPTAAITQTSDPRVATRTRGDLVRRGDELVLAGALSVELRRRLGRHLRLRVVDTGDCGACAGEIEAVAVDEFGLEAFGIELVLSPRHADGLLVTGPLTPAMRAPLRRAWEATAAPRLVIAFGACAISGGPFRTVTTLRGLAGDSSQARTENTETRRALPIDLYVPGCPPHPLTLLDGLLRLIGEGGARIKPGEGSSGSTLPPAL